ncbi:thioredoxin family protein [Fusobacterium sp. IOR10]|uniref:thioredoxin family protein n=1 Tax=Fusobacterium sp. IOR10 TaxID=2665157 RepID=UPI0013D4EEA2|nr:thioredoxin family protein [Fusobacterium sp. IOR10]
MNTIKILGSGCKKCKALEANTREGMAELNLEANIEHVTDMGKIMAYGVMSTPALVINDKVVSTGKVLKVNEAKEIIKKNL